MAGSARIRGTSRWLPLVAMVLAYLLAILVLPSALRPPPQRPNATAELSPDAPPNDNADSLVSSLSRGTSGTAGAGVGEGTGDAPGGAGPQQQGGPDGPLRAAPPRSCPGGFGNPARQVESLYSAPCAGAFAGDNGGATSRGVTANEVRVVITYRGGDTGVATGPVSDTPSPRESAQNRTLRVYQQYFNKNFQFWGRHLQLYVNSISTNADNQRAGAQAADEQYHAFGSVIVGGPAVPYMQEAGRRHLVSFGGISYARKFYLSQAPYEWAWNVDGTTAEQLSAEYICKKLAAKKAAYAGDDDLKGRTRVFGLVWYAEDAYDGNDTAIAEALQKDCGEHIAVSVPLDLRATQDYGQNTATAASKFRASNVTTIIDAANALAITQIGSQSDSINYHPEWFITGIDFREDAVPSRRIPPTQWSHAFGLTFGEFPRPDNDLDSWRAYHSIDASDDPHPQTAADGFYALLQMANGIQLAGPTLNPESFRRGLAAAGHRAPNPLWAEAGGYGVNDPTYSDYAAVMWWDPTATHPVDGEPGAYRYVDGGRRYTYGEFDSSAPRVFEEGVLDPAAGA